MCIRDRLIHSDGVGYDRIDLAAARERGIYVCNCAGCNAGPVAELAVTLMSIDVYKRQIRTVIARLRAVWQVMQAE